ncbi:hypothetical protein KAT92_06645 [Candidatus Babeliales bacterium]|nr:hypothetical protein [Candidatus Babeliales bacterium]
MARFKGYLTGSSSCNRTGTKNTGIHARLSSTKGLEVFTVLFVLPDGQEAARVRLEVRGKPFPLGTWIVDEDGNPKKIH